MSNFEQYATPAYYFIFVALAYMVIRIYNRVYRRDWRWTAMDRMIAIMQSSAGPFIIPFYLLMIAIMLIDRDFFCRYGMGKKVKW